MYVASLNTAAATELCVRTIHKYAGTPFTLVVGDSGSTDRTLPRLRGFEQRGWLTLEEAPEGRRHAEWLNHWVATCTTRYATFVDSDMEFLADGWLADLVARAGESSAALVTSRVQELGDRGHRDRDGTAVRWAPRPTAWLMMVDVAQVRNLDAGFGFRYADDPDSPGARIAYDTGAFLYAQLAEHGLVCSVMPPGWDACYHHFGGMTWIRQVRATQARRVKQTLKRGHIWLRLQRARLSARRAFPTAPDE